MEQPATERKQVYTKSSKRELLLIITKSRNSTFGHLTSYIL